MVQHDVMHCDENCIILFFSVVSPAVNLNGINSITEDLLKISVLICCGFIFEMMTGFSTWLSPLY